MKKYFKPEIIVSLLIYSYAVLFLSVNTFAGDNDLMFKHITTEDGLSHSNVTCILQDHQRIMWFGTFDGLNKFDGYNFTIYRRELDDPTSICSNIIRSIFEDDQGNLWIGTREGLSRYDRNLDAFINYNKEYGFDLDKFEIFSVIKDRQGQLWIGTNNYGLYILNPSNNQSIHYSVQENELKSLNSNIIRQVFEDSKGNLWIATEGGGLNLFNRDTQTFTHFEHQINDPNSLLSNSVLSMIEDSEGFLWISCYGAGLSCIHVDKISGHSFTNYQHDPENTNSLSNNRIFSLCEDKNGGIWIGTENGGLNLLQKDMKTFTHYETNQNDLYSLNNNSIYSVYKDIVGDIWIGTFFGGINLINYTKQGFKHYKNLQGNPNSLSYNSVLEFSEDKKGNIWIATDGGGLNVFNPETKNFEYYNSKNSNLNSDAVLTVFVDSQNDVWTGTWTGGVSLFDKQTKCFLTYTTENSELSNNNVFDIAEDRNGNLWFATQRGINRFDKTNKQFHFYNAENSDLISNYVEVLEIGHDGNLLVGTSNGFVVFNPQTEKFINFVHEQGNDNSLSDNYITTIFEEDENTIWLTTYNGLNKLDRKVGTITRYFTSDGLPNDLIFGIEKDDIGQLWISTNGGISKFDPVTGHFRNYTKIDGLQSNTFIKKSHYKTRDGILYFGGTNGFNAFNPLQLIDNTTPPPIMITDFQIFNKPVRIGIPESPLKKQISQSDEIILSHKQSVFSFKYTALNYVSSEKNQYAYMLEGFDKDWNYVGYQRTATYTNLDPGEYIFRVKGSNNDGVWNENGTAINVFITPPFWRTLWFKAISLSCLILFILLIHKIRTRSIIQRNKHLELKVKERTIDLQTANNELVNKKNLLQTVIDLVPDLIFVKDRQNRYILNNRAHLEFAGLERQEEIIGKTAFDFFPGGNVENFHRDEQIIMETGQAILDKEEKIIDPISGEINWILSSTVQFKDGRGEVQGIVGISHLINDRKQFEEELKHSKELAEAANRSKSLFLANMSHEIRTPMNGVIGMTELTLDTELTKQQRDYLQIAKQSAESLLYILNDILDFSKIEAGKLELEEIDFDVRSLLETAVTTLSAQAYSKGLEILCNIKNNVPIALKGDPGRLRQIIVNLVGNAIKFTEKGEIVVCVELNNSPIISDEIVGLHFSVSDTGIGIAKDKVDKIFESFSQADSSTTRKFGGTGLGLTISQKLTELMGGKIWAESEFGKGSTFHFTAYLKHGYTQEIEDFRNSLKEMGRIRVLIVDDNNTNCIILQEFLKANGLDPVIAWSGREALNLLYQATVEENLFSLILLDFQMPEMNGLEFAGKVRSNSKWNNIKIIMMSSVIDRSDLGQGQKLCIDNFLLKPIRQMELMQSILNILKIPDSEYDVKENIRQNEHNAISLNILLAEDNVINQKVAVNFLKNWGHNVTIANDGREAIEKMESQDFDLVFMDVQMPNMDGLEATRIIRNSSSENINSHIPIIAMTAHSMKGDRERFLEAGMSNYIAKPINVDEVRSVLKIYQKIKVQQKFVTV